MSCLPAVGDSWEAVAKACGVTRQAIQQHARSAAPWFPKGAIATDKQGKLRVKSGGGGRIVAAFLEYRGESSSGRQAGMAASDAHHKLRAALTAEKVRQAQIETRRMQRLEAIAEGNILPRDEYTLFVRECISLSRDQFANLPKQLSALVSKRDRVKLRDEGHRIVCRILDDLAARLAAGPDRA